MDSLTKIAKILRTDKDVIKGTYELMSKRLNKDHEFLDNIIKDNDDRVNRSLEILGGKRDGFASEVYNLLISKIRVNDSALFHLFKEPEFVDFNGCRILIEAAQELAAVGDGFFLKQEKATEFLRLNPPQNILKALKYKDVNELLEKENLFEIFAALRFIEDRDWLNRVFFKMYDNLKSDDFEERKIRVSVLNKKWMEIAETFLKKKYHNISHLKELGLIFIIPLDLKASGETLRTFTLILHYLHEIDFYSKLFKKYAIEEENFGKRLISSLRGDVLDKRIDNPLKANWLIVQRYLAKEDEYDWRLFYPHVNPEAIHWRKAENDVTKLSKKFPNLELDFWYDLDYIGDYFKSESGVDTLVSFNLIDTVMSLVQEKEMIKYLYHHQESLWNKIFSDFVGEKETEELIINSFDKGYIEI